MTIGFDLLHDLDLEFSRSNIEIGYISAKNGPIATKRKANISIDLKTSNVTIRSDLGHDLDLKFSRSNAKLAISLPKMVRLPWNEKQTHQLNSRPQIWPSDLTLAVTLTLNLKVKYEICYISTKCGPIATKQKANILIWTLGLKCDNGFDLGHDIDIWIFKVICRVHSRQGNVRKK